MGNPAAYVDIIQGYDHLPQIALWITAIHSPLPHTGRAGWLVFNTRCGYHIGISIGPQALD
jgi:hypothetical protein